MGNLTPEQVDALILALEWPSCLDGVPEWAIESSSDSAFGRGPGGQSISYRLNRPGRLLAQAYKREMDLQASIEDIQRRLHAAGHKSAAALMNELRNLPK